MICPTVKSIILENEFHTTPGPDRQPDREVHIERVRIEEKIQVFSLEKRFLLNANALVVVSIKSVKLDTLLR